MRPTDPYARPVTGPYVSLVTGRTNSHTVTGGNFKPTTGVLHPFSTI